MWCVLFIMLVVSFMMKTIYDVSIVLINQIDDVLTSIQYRRHYRCVISVH